MLGAAGRKGNLFCGDFVQTGVYNPVTRMTQGTAMKSKFAHTLDLVRANGGFPGLGFKRAAIEANAERTMMRFALEAFRNPPLATAIDRGTITDPKVVQAFHRLPALAVGIVCHLEARLGRRLSRARAERLVGAYLKVTGREVAPPDRESLATSSEASTLRHRQIPMPRLPAFF